MNFMAMGVPRDKITCMPRNAMNEDISQIQFNRPFRVLYAQEILKHAKANGLGQEPWAVTLERRLAERDLPPTGMRHKNPPTLPTLMITINHPSVQTEGNAVTISYPILQDGHAPRTLSFTVDSRFRDFLNPGRADGALVALLPWISQQGGQVRVLPAISAHLYHFGIRLLSHILTGIGPFLKPVELAGEVHAEVLSPIPGCRIGTGGSLGVDSLCTIAELEKAGTPVTHLFHNNCGSHWGNRELLEGRRKLSRNFAEKNGMEFVWMDSSLYDFYGNEGYLNWFPFLDSGSVLVLNGLMNSYWTSATYHINHPDFTTRDRRDYCEFHLQSHILSAAETEQGTFPPCMAWIWQGMKKQPSLPIILLPATSSMFVWNVLSTAAHA